MKKLATVLEKLLGQAGLSDLFENKKDLVVEAVWAYIEGFYIVNETTPVYDTIRILIWETIRFLPNVTDFYTLFDAPKKTKEDLIKYLIEKFYNYSLQKLREAGRITI